MNIFLVEINLLETMRNAIHFIEFRVPKYIRKNTFEFDLNGRKKIGDRCEDEFSKN